MMTDPNETAGAAQLRAERQAVETLYRAFSDKDPDLLDSAVTADWDDIPLSPGQGPGPDGLKPILRSIVQAMPDVRITIHDWIQVPGRIGVRAEMTGTHQGPLFGIPPTGKPVRLRMHEFHEFAGDRIQRTWHLEDWFGLFQQIGTFPAPSGEDA